MVIAMPAPTVAADAAAPAVLTPRSRAAARLLTFEDVWAELDGADRGYFASELEDLAQQAREAREGGAVR